MKSHYISLKLLFLFCTAFVFGEEEVLSLTRTSHTLSFEEETIPYTAVTGTIPIFNKEGDDAAEIFFIAYIKDEEKSQRPITFFFPGGPGGSSASLVMCSLGPKRILTPDEGKGTLPPYEIIDNPETILPWTDIVFVDPVGSGYSTITDDEELVKLFSVEGDIEALSDFIRSFISYFERWHSPKYLAGGSYGTTRCCGLCEELLSYDLSLHGIILLGSAADYSTLISQQNHPLPDCLLLPTFAATAWYHGRLWPEKSLEEVVEYARRFALDSYALTMIQPTRLSPYQKEIFYQDLSHLIGLPLDTVKKYQGRLNERLFTSEFFGAERKIVGGLDSRYVGDMSTISRWGIFEDPSYKDMQGIHCTFNSYLQQDLETKKPLDPYITFSGALYRWDFFTFDSIYLPDLFQRVRRTLVHNPNMRIFVGSGYYDCRTPFAATEFCFDHLDLPEKYKKNFQFEYYKAGHGFIFHAASLKKLRDDLVTFYTAPSKKRGH